MLKKTIEGNCIRKNQEIIMIAAIQNDRAIGYKGKLIHSLRNDMRHFVKQTTGHSIIMGRKNWESIPEKYRPLKNRENIIITRNNNYIAQGAIIVGSIEEALRKSSHQKIYIIGGGEIYRLGMSYATILDLTIINDNKPGDAFFPSFKSSFRLSKKSEPTWDEKTNLEYQFQTWEKK